MNTAPSTDHAPRIIGVKKKSILSIHEDSAIEQACLAQVGVESPLPVFHGMEQLGFVVGRRGSREVTFYADRQTLDQVVMAGITKYDDIIAAMGAGRRYTALWSKAHTTAPVISSWYDLFPVSGNPVSGVYAGAANTSVQWADTSIGSIAHAGNVGVTFNKYMTYIMGNATAGTVGPTVVLYDRVLTYEAVVFTNATTQTFTNTLAAQRYIAGAPGMLIMVTGQLVASATQHFLSYIYVNQAGLAGQSLAGTATTTNVVPSYATPTASLGTRVVSPSVAVANALTAGYAMPLVTGDTGVRSITSIVTSAQVTPNTGKLCFVLMRPLAVLSLGSAGAPSEKDLVAMTTGMTQVFDGACLNLLALFPTATAATLTGGFDVTWN